MPTYKDHLVSSMSTKKSTMVPKPSSSVVLISPTNQILLLHRVRTSSAFPSAHVFPGGNVSTEHDGAVPPEGDPARHVDALPYRLAAVRETFEESGILLVRHKESGALLELPDDVREKGRREVHAGRELFPEWLERLEGVADTENLVPFTRWVTPPQVPKRFTTQMYLYFLPFSSPSSSSSSSQSTSEAGSAIPSSRETVIPPPTSDGGLEHTAARFLPASTWLDMARAGEIILYPPQYTLLHLVSQFLSSTPDGASPSGPNVSNELEQQRRNLLAFARGGDPPWADAVISPASEGRAPDGREILGLRSLPPELAGSERRGIPDLVVLIRPSAGGFRNLEVRTREEVLSWRRRLESESGEREGGSGPKL